MIRKNLNKGLGLKLLAFAAVVGSMVGGSGCFMFGYWEGPYYHQPHPYRYRYRWNRPYKYKIPPGSYYYQPPTKQK